jgi:hypothetical protein
MMRRAAECRRSFFRPSRAGETTVALAAVLAAGGAMGAILLLALLSWLFSGGARATPTTAPPPRTVEQPDQRLARPKKWPEGLAPPTLGESAAAVAEAATDLSAAWNNPELLALINYPGSARPSISTLAGRWELRFPRSMPVEHYARALDALKIELAVVQPRGELSYVMHFSGKPKTWTAPAADERRFYFTWRGGEMDQADRDLLKRGGVDAGDFVVLHIVPETTEERLLALEKEHAGERASHLRKTRFGIRAEKGSFVPVVLEQWYW